MMIDIWVSENELNQIIEALMGQPFHTVSALIDKLEKYKSDDN